MQSIKINVGTERSRRRLKIILIIIAALLLGFFLIRFVPLSHKNEEVEFLRIVDRSNPLAESYVPELVEVEGVQVAQSCAEAMTQMLAAARQAGCEPLLIEGYIDRKSQQMLYDEHIRMLVEKGNSPEDAAHLALKTMSEPGADEHQLGLTVDIVDAKFPDKSSALADSDTYKWLSEHSWDYGFVIRYPDGKSDVTGRDFMPWHFRYVGVESAQLMRELQLCLEEYYTWFYSDEVIIIVD